MSWLTTAATWPYIPDPADPEPEELTKYSDEYRDLLTLIDLTVREGVPAAEVDQLLHQYPFKTIDDVATISAKLINLATTTYQIPRELLLKKLKLKRRKLMSWLKKADEMPFPPKAAIPGAPAAPAKPPMSEKDDVATGEKISKDLKTLIQREKQEKEPKDVKLLEEALKKVEEFLKGEKEEAKKEEKEKKDDKPE